MVGNIYNQKEGRMAERRKEGREDTKEAKVKGGKGKEEEKS